MTGPDRPWRQRAALVRDCPLLPLATTLGYRPDPANPARWKRPGSVLSIRGSKFFDHRQGRGGGGAIDLVMHARGCRFQQAVAFLESHGPPPVRVPCGPLPPAGPLRLPAPCPRHWPAVQDYLADSRRLPPQLLRRCRLDGLLYADSRRNAVFLCRDRNHRPAGAELVGTLPPPPGARRFRAMAPGSRKARGGFWLLHPGRSRPPAAVFLVESAIDALSAAALPAINLPPRTLIASAGGLVSRLPSWLLPLQRLPLLCGFDNDPAGHQAARALARNCPSLQRFSPHPAKDWNDLLRQASLP